MTWYSIRCPEGLVIPPTEDVEVALMWLKTMHDMEHPGYRFNGAGLVIVDPPASSSMPRREENREQDH